MKMKNALLAATVAVAGLSSATAANAAIVVGTTINGLATFTDTNTGNNWVKLNAFTSQSYTSMAATVTAAGFTLANLSNVQTLLNSLPLNSTTFASYNTIMGGSSSRSLLWAAYGPATSGQVNWAYAYNTDTTWSYAANATSATSAYSDMGIFAFQAGAVPETATWGMMLLGFGLIGGAARYRRRSVKLAYTAA